MAIDVDKEKILNKLKKLRAMADGGTRYEQENAKRLIDKLLEKYEVDPDSLDNEPRTPHMFKYQKGYKALAHQLIFHLELDATRVGNHTVKNTLMIKASETEWKLYEQFYYAAEGYLERKRKEVLKKFHDFQEGYVDASYPSLNKGPKCPFCGAECEFVDEERYYYKCPKCGYTTKKRKRQIRRVSNEYYKGQRSSKKLLMEN